MPYIGHNPTQAGSFVLLDDIASGFDGSDVTFTLQIGGVDITPTADNLIIALDGVIQHSPEAYSVSGSTLTFTAAPASGVDFYGMLMGQSASIGQGAIGADELSVTGDGSANQMLVSDGDGTMTWKGSGISATSATGDLIYRNSSGELARLAVGSAGQVLTVASGLPAWETDVESYLPLSGGTMSGALNMGSQAITNAGTITGTFSGNLTGNVTGNTSGTAASVTGASQGAITSVGTLTGLTGGTGDLIWDTTTLVVDSSADKVGIGTSSPSSVCTQSKVEIKGLPAFLGLHCDGSDPNGSSGIEFGDSSDGNIGQIHYYHGDNSMNFTTNTSVALSLKNDQSATFAGDIDAAKGVFHASSYPILKVAYDTAGDNRHLWMNHDQIRFVCNDNVGNPATIAKYGGSSGNNKISFVLANQDGSNLTNELVLEKSSATFAGDVLINDDLIVGRGTKSDSAGSGYCMKWGGDTGGSDRWGFRVATSSNDEDLYLDGNLAGTPHTVMTWDKVNGHVGIGGVTSPTYALTVNDSNPVDGNIATFDASVNGGFAGIRIANTYSAGGSTDETCGIAFKLGNGDAVIEARKYADTETGNNRDIGLAFKIQNNNSVADALVIDDNKTATFAGQILSTRGYIKSQYTINDDEIMRLGYPTLDNKYNDINWTHQSSTSEVGVKLRFYQRPAGGELQIHTGRSGNQTLTETVSFGEDHNTTFAGKIDVNTAGSSITQESWNEVTPSSPFSNYGSTWDTCAYMKDSNGVVHLKGLVTGTHTGASTIFTLPSGYRPSKERMFPCISSASPDRALRVDIQADGDVIVDSTHSGWVSISNISFKI